MTAKERVLRKYPNAYSHNEQAGFMPWAIFAPFRIGTGATCKQAWENVASRLRSES